MTDLLGGRISFMIDVMLNVRARSPPAAARAGRDHAGTGGVHPDIPTVSEAAGVKGYEFYAWDGLYAPGHAGRSADKLNAALNQVLQKPEVRKMLESRGAIPSPTTRAGLKDFGAERLGWAVVKTAGASID